MGRLRKDSTKQFIQLIMSSVLILVAVFVWPKNNNLSQSNEVNKKETQIKIVVKIVNMPEILKMNLNLYLLLKEKKIIYL